MPDSELGNQRAPCTHRQADEGRWVPRRALERDLAPVVDRCSPPSRARIGHGCLLFRSSSRICQRGQYQPLQRRGETVASEDGCCGCSTAPLSRQSTCSDATHLQLAVRPDRRGSPHPSKEPDGPPDRCQIRPPTPSAASGVN